jgi:tyrosyl-DNA phosphodiesterase 2
MARQGPVRLHSAPKYLITLLESLLFSTAILILLQEIIASDLKQLSEMRWVRAYFGMSDLTPENWHDCHYGTVTLVDRRLVVRLQFVSEYERDGLGVDLEVRSKDEPSGWERESANEGGLPKGEKVFRIVNSHLGSMAANPPMRPRQMAAVGRWVSTRGCVAGILAGDMNANRPYDRTMPRENGFKDTYLELGGFEDAEDGMTWGYQSNGDSARRFGPSRLDKALVRGEVKVKRFQ